MNQSFDSTKTRILDTAERLFADHGFAATSLRQITTEAGVNLASVNYHFQSKESLFQAVILRRLEPVNARRLELLNEFRASQRKLTLEKVLCAFIQPIFEARAQGSNIAAFARILARIYTEPGALMQQFFIPHMHPVVKEFFPAMRQALPGITPEAMFWGMQFFVGGMAHSISRIESLTPRDLGFDFDLPPVGLQDHLIRFTASGMRGLLAKSGGQS